MFEINKATNLIYRILIVSLTFLMKFNIKMVLTISLHLLCDMLAIFTVAHTEQLTIVEIKIKELFLQYQLETWV